MLKKAPWHILLVYQGAFITHTKWDVFLGHRANTLRAAHRKPHLFHVFPSLHLLAFQQAFGMISVPSILRMLRIEVRPTLKPVSGSSECTYEIYFLEP